MIWFWKFVLLASYSKLAATTVSRSLKIVYNFVVKDADEFKSGVKDSITDWMKKLRERNIVDWMIIQVVAQDSLRGNKPKLTLPRSTVFDKIKSDFGGKNSER